MHAPRIGIIITTACHVIEAGIIPEHEVSILPLMRILPSGIGEHEAEELIEQRLRLRILAFGT